MQNKPVFGVPPLFTRLGLYVLVAIALAFVGGFVFLIYSAFEGDVVSSPANASLLMSRLRACATAFFPRSV